MESRQAPLVASTGESKGHVELPAVFFAEGGSRRTLQESIVALRANQRRGTSMTKTRGLVRGGGRKPWKQKGTGNARSGSIRSPLWRKGGIIFGPLPRSYRHDVDQAKRLLALRTALQEKANASEISVIESLDIPQPKTREAAQLMKKAGALGNTLVVVDTRTPAFDRAFGNLAGIQVVDAASVNAWQLMAAKRILFTQAALSAVEKRFPKG